MKQIKARLAKKNPNIQCRALELLDFCARNGPVSLQKVVATEEYCGLLKRLLKIPGVSPLV